jgi:antitoxin (DNA-binding transcriptional repressor) of toxin-antitoxin stability system
VATIRNPEVVASALFEAKNRLSELGHRAESGEEISITRRGKVVARRVAPVAVKATQRVLDAVAALRSARRGIGKLSSADLMRQGRR